ncbi:MAG: porin family protein [Mariniphaga sp.]|nr:porin family protein [Mariniphaga sp.]
MKQFIISLFFILITMNLAAQPSFSAGLKAGINNSKVSVDHRDFSEESIVKAHVGIFGRLGLGRIYLQPEAYFISKGGEVFSPNLMELDTKFDFQNIDVPLLLGLKILDGEKANLRIMAGPVLSILTSSEITGDELLREDYYKNHYYGYQYGVGVDFGNLFLDARFEHGANKLYYHPGLEMDGKNRTFMVTAGFKIF